MNVHEVFMMYS